MHVKDSHGRPHSGRILRLTCACLVLLALPGQSWARKDNGLICIQLLSRTQPVPVEKISRTRTDAILSKVFDARLPTADEVATRPTDVDPELVESGLPRNISRNTLKCFLEVVRDPRMYHHRVVGFEDLDTFLQGLTPPLRPPSWPRRSHQVAGAIPGAVTLAAFGASVWAPLGSAEILDAFGLAGVFAHIVAAVFYHDTWSAPWYDRIAELLRDFEHGHARKEVLLSRFQLRVPQAELTEFVDRSKDEPTHLEIEHSPTERGFLDYVGTRLLDRARAKPWVTLEFWSFLYFDGDREQPVFIYGIPR